jgi:hypothetical protein
VFQHPGRSRACQETDEKVTSQDVSRPSSDSGYNPLMQHISSRARMKGAVCFRRHTHRSVEAFAGARPSTRRRAR